MCGLSTLAVPFSQVWWLKSMVQTVSCVSEWGIVMLMLQLPACRQVQTSIVHRMLVKFGSVVCPLFLMGLRCGMWFAYGPTLWTNWTSLSTLGDDYEILESNLLILFEILARCSILCSALYEGHLEEKGVTSLYIAFGLLCFYKAAQYRTAKYTTYRNDTS